MTLRRLAVAAAFVLAAAAASAARADAQPLRVCADPDYMPFSNRAGQGFENKLAQAVGRALGERVQYVWRSMRGPGGFDQFLHDTLNAGRCDVVMNVPYASENVLVTRPYYVSAYGFVYPKKRRYDITSMDSPVLKGLRIGFEQDTPPETGLKLRALILHATPFDVGDTPGESPADILTAVKSGKVGVAVTWQPSIGYFMRSYPDLAFVALPNSRAAGTIEQYVFPMAMAARKGDTRTRDALDGAIGQNKDELQRVLRSFGVLIYTGPSDTPGASS
ncbi:MAG: mxaJ protein [Candidatus Eremiobacteraeota bacterium]|jgi:mxaJ protein|nr:mxaJ protein [Candidatus Eremiobacteraeota bacterium]